jgi:predicted RNA binding protein YcfA (HicA-like mRNA interferase family)
MTFRDVEKILKKDGWYICRTNGSHYQFAHPEKNGLVTLPHHSGDYKKGTLKSIWQQAGLK